MALRQIASLRSRLMMLLVLMGSVRAALGGDTPPRDVLRIARSNDGLRFTVDAEPLAVGGSSPDIERLDDGSLIVVYDASKESTGEATIMTLRRSKDGGRTWTTPTSIEFSGSSLRGKAARGGDLVVEEDDSLTLYFSATAEGSGQRSKKSAIIRSATSKDGDEFKVAPSSAYRCRGVASPQTCVVRTGAQRVMLVSEAATVKSNKDQLHEIHRAVSRDGRVFATTAAVQLSTNVRITSLVALDNGFRGYGWNDDGIVSLTSDDLKEWELDDGIRMTGAWDPAVVRLKNGTYVMIFNAGPTPAAGPNEATETVDGVAPRIEGDEGLARQEDDPEWLAEEEMDASGLAPPPDFAQPIDYAKWYRENALEPTEDNAFDAYLEFMPRFDEEGTTDREWPEFKDMFNGGEHEGPPVPWKPEDHPEWEQTHINAREVLTKFREANLRTGYAMRVEPTPDSDPLGPAEDRLLINLQLPHLAPHRMLAKATLADAWRAGTDGKVDGEKMIEAWKTVLRGAEHVERGSTLIENLVGIAERRLVEINARAALDQGVFDAKQMERALETLRQFDRNATDPVSGVRGEHAMALDTTQYLFSPPDAQGRPSINPDRVERIQELMGDESGTSRDEVEKMTPEDAKATIRAFDGYYRELGEQMRIGYPDVRASDLEASTERYANTSPITKIMLPSLSRVHTLRARTEASRRATQLSYAVHIHRARTGQWPKSLDDLPSEFGGEMRTDPFSGRPFGYRVGKDGPTIYSVSENGIDDGGVHSPRWGDNAEDEAASDDHVFWPPQE